ncbi:MAG: Holo-[acyl-carrier-protein] synthase [Desulfovibrio sp.]
MILGLGLDVTELSRISRSWERFGMRFAEKILHPDELAHFTKLSASRAVFLASRFAVKEAAVKALGTGFSGGISPTDISVLPDSSGKPVLRLSGKAGERANERGAAQFHVSLTHGKETVAAVVILEGDGK